MTGLWGQAIDVEVAYRQAEVRESYQRRRANRAPRQPHPAPAPVRRAVVIGAPGMAGAAAGMMTASGRR